MLHTISIITILIAILFTTYKIYLHHTNWAKRYNITNRLWYYGPLSWYQRSLNNINKIPEIDRQCYCDSVQILCQIHTNNWQWASIQTNKEQASGVAKTVGELKTELNIGDI